MQLPQDLQGDPVEFYHQTKTKKKHGHHKIDSDSDSTPEKTLERKNSSKGNNQQKQSLCSISESYKGDNSLDQECSLDQHESPNHKVPKQESDISWIEQSEVSVFLDISGTAGDGFSSNADASFSSNAATVQNCDINGHNKAECSAHLHNVETVNLNDAESCDSSYQATESVNIKLSTENKCTGDLAR